MPSCHSPRPGHCRTPTWATPAGQDQSRCNVPTPLWLMHVSWGENQDSEKLGDLPSITWHISDEMGLCPPQLGFTRSVKTLQS